MCAANLCMVLALSFTLLHRVQTRLVTRSCGAFCAAPPARFSESAWRQTQFDKLDNFERISLASSLLDDADIEVVNHAAWRGLGYTVDEQGRLHDADGRLREDPPDFMNDSAALAKLESSLPLEDEEAMAGLETVIETLHGQELTRIKMAEGSTEFTMRRVVVSCLHYYGLL
mmetsp:Transcript_8863/g.17880  ORF Transcript_8863/g.17880 Transcript_8863/m.17880 type:complete len:172 (+) Transcript_8863:2-517(+)|eukprot:CAMPEP_0119069470 /NCGR_PEP_ID=MMETSP1178-20130426/19582_1 /TAXON_ID=33656 /ORGANISM="unid sp, Strain CCMP2000" /LENGTH=171 /DNA_ID=CAMNT_0007051237 /DNA_START=1 /DNA_END=516 /DNA_ORIENTATION=-